MPGRRGRGRGRSSGRPGMRTLLRHEFNGCHFKPPHQPPPIVSTPWNAITLQLGGDGKATETKISGKEIAAVLLKQAGLTGVSATFDFRIQKIRLWNLSTARPIRLSVYGFDNTSLPGAGALAVLDDWPDKYSFARLGYEFSRSLQQAVYSSDSTALIATVDCSAGLPWLMYLDILWRCNKYTPIESTLRYQLTFTEPPEESSSSSISIVNTNPFLD